jgi:hypothetical protein
MLRAIPLRLCVAACLALASTSLHAQAVPHVALPTGPAPRTSTFDRVFRVVAWPGYGMAMRDPSPLGRMQKLTLANERIGFVMDATTSWVALRTNSHESDQMNRAFGSSSQAGVLGSMAAWELSFNYASAAAPRWIRNPKLRAVARVGVVVGGSLLVRERFQVSLANIRTIHSER